MTYIDQRADKIILERNNVPEDSINYALPMFRQTFEYDLICITLVFDDIKETILKSIPKIL